MSSICSKFGVFALYFLQQVLHRVKLILIKTVASAHRGLAVLGQLEEDLVCQSHLSSLPLSLPLSLMKLIAQDC